MLWEEAAEQEFPEDEDEFEESVVAMREKLFGASTEWSIS